MKFGIRKPSLRKSIAARTSIKRYVRQNLVLKHRSAMAGLPTLKKHSTTGCTTDPQKAVVHFSGLD